MYFESGRSYSWKVVIISVIFLAQTSEPYATLEPVAANEIIRLSACIRHPTRTLKIIFISFSLKNSTALAPAPPPCENGVLK